MDWGQRISEISSRAARTLGFLRRNLAFAPRSTKEVAYKTLVRPRLGCAAPVWGPCSGLRIGRVGKVQRTAARWACRGWRNAGGVGGMLGGLGWPSLGALGIGPPCYSFMGCILVLCLWGGGQVPDPCSRFEICRVVARCPVLWIPGMQ